MTEYMVLNTFSDVEEVEDHDDNWDCWCEPMIVWLPCSCGKGIQMVQHD